MKKFLVLVFLITFSNGFCQVSEDYMESSLVKLNQEVPEFSFTTAEGKTIPFSDYKGKVVLINFFATWCAPCLQEMPYVQKDIWDKLKNNPNFVVVSFGRDHSQEEITKFIAKKKFTWPIYADKGKSIYNLFATKYIPRNYLVDQNGTIVYASSGFSVEEFELLKSKITTLLKK